MNVLYIRDHPFKTSEFFSGEGSRISQICRRIVAKKLPAAGLADGSGGRGQKLRKICQLLKWIVPMCTYRCVHHITLYMRATVLSVQKSFVLQMFEFRPKFFFLLPALAPESRPSYSLPWTKRFRESWLLYSVSSRTMYIHMYIVYTVESWFKKDFGNRQNLS